MAEKPDPSKRCLSIKEGILAEKENLLKMSEISLWLDTYNDIFSSFDPRPYSEKSLSVDFLNEAKRASREKISGQTELKFLVPADKRNTHDEELIQKRLHEHFRKHQTMIKKEIRSTILYGIISVLIGIGLMFLATYILFQYKPASLISSFFVIVFEPAGWFSFWEGLNLIVFKWKDKKPDLEFYEKMSKLEIHFLSY